jgi:hypothetical protein
LGISREIPKFLDLIPLEFAVQEEKIGGTPPLNPDKPKLFEQAGDVMRASRPW